MRAAPPNKKIEAILLVFINFTSLIIRPIGCYIWPLVKLPLIYLRLINHEVNSNLKRRIKNLP